MKKISIKFGYIFLVIALFMLKMTEVSENMEVIHNSLR